MLQISKRSKTFVFLSLILLILFFFFNRKSFFVIFDNIQIIKSMNFSLLQNEKKKNELTEIISDFENKKEFRELIVKEKLFFKDKSEKVIFYDLDD
tara:strand:- start:258 stop:545 length:288 start_codon:yes stop_codon:yes gene_type:complete